MSPTPVIFRKEILNGHVEITAVFPTERCNPRGDFTCYAHVGQHSACTRGWYLDTQAAKPEEYAPLLAELRRIGYDDLKVYSRWSAHFWKVS